MCNSDEIASCSQQEKPVFLVNPASHSGKGLEMWKQVEALLLGREIPYEAHLSKQPGDMSRLARRLRSERETLFLIILGGDGSVNEALQGLDRLEGVKLGYIPTGSSNDLARDLGIPKDPAAAMEAILAGTRECRMDVGCVSWTEQEISRRRYFLVGCGIGYDAAICAQALRSSFKDFLNRLGLGKLTYLGIGVRHMVTAPMVTGTLVLDGERGIPLEKLLFAACMSHRYEGGGFCFCPDADAQDGLLDVCVVDGVPRWKLPFLIPFALKGKHLRFHGVECYRASSVELETDRPLWVQTDGEVPGRMNHISVTVEKQKLHFIY